jgi:hypothetical protein
VKPIIEKVLASGLVDRSVAEYMEKLGLLPEGAVEIVNEDALKGATKEHLTTLAKDLAEEVEREHKIRETSLDLDRLRFPVTVEIEDGLKTVRENVPGVVDRMGRFYFNIVDVDKSWLTVGYTISRRTYDNMKLGGHIVEAQLLYVGDAPVCWQVSVA